MTVTAAKLARAAARIEANLTDTCSLLADPEGGGDDEFDPITFATTPAPDDVTTRWIGALGLKPFGRSRKPFVDPQTGRQIAAMVALLPLSCPEPVVGQWLEVLTAGHLPDLVGRKLGILEVSDTTLAPCRQVVVSVERPVQQ